MRRQDDGDVMCSDRAQRLLQDGAGAFVLASQQPSRQPVQAEQLALASAAQRLIIESSTPFPSVLAVVEGGPSSAVVGAVMHKGRVCCSFAPCAKKSRPQAAKKRNTHAGTRKSDVFFILWVCMLVQSTIPWPAFVAPHLAASRGR